MSKQTMNEATVNLSITDLNSTDLGALSRMLELAGQAEAGSAMGNDPFANPALYSDPSMGTGPMDDFSDPSAAGAEGGFEQGLEAPETDGSEFLADDDMTDEFDDMPGIFESINRMMELSGANLGGNDLVDLSSANGTEDLDDSELTEDEHNNLVGRIGSAISGAKMGSKVGSLVGPEGTAAGAVVGGAMGWNASAPDKEVDESIIPLGDEYSSETSGPEWYDPFSDTQCADEFGAGDAYDDVPSEFAQSPFPEDEQQVLVIQKPASVSMRETMEALESIDTEELTEEDEVEEDEGDLIEEAALYDFAIDEDATKELKSPGIGDNRVFGPYPNKMAALVDARKECPGGAEGVDFKFQHKPDGFYWCKLGVNEDCQRAKQKAINPESFKGDKSNTQKKVPAKAGDNGLVVESRNLMDFIKSFKD